MQGASPIGGELWPGNRVSTSTPNGNISSFHRLPRALTRDSTSAGPVSWWPVAWSPGLAISGGKSPPTLVAAGPPPRSTPGLGLSCASPPGPGREAVLRGSGLGAARPEAILPARVPGPDDPRGWRTRPRQCLPPGHRLPEHRKVCAGPGHRGAAEPHSLEAVDQPPCVPVLPSCHACRPMPPHGLFPKPPSLPLYQGLGTVLASLTSALLAGGAGISQGEGPRARLGFSAEIPRES